MPTASDALALQADPQVAVPNPRRGWIAHASDQEWAVSALLLCLDVVSWFLIYGFTNLVRGDAYYSSAFVFFVVDLLQVTVIVTALYTIRWIRPEHGDPESGLRDGASPAIICAGVVSAALIYSAAGLVRSADCGEGG